MLSKDGTAIAFDRIGHGAPVILVDAALCHRGMGQSRQLAELLAPHFTVITYDRRSRGESGDTAPYAVEREVEDIAARLSEVGGSAYLWGMSSGAVLALEAASRLSGIKKLALYEAPFIVDDSRSTTEHEWARIREALATDQRGAAVKFLLHGVGVPRFFIALMLLSPVWSKLKAIAHTLPYDAVLVQDNQRVCRSGKALGIRDGTDAGDGRGKEAPVDAQRDSCARARIAERAIPLARGPDAPTEAEGARTHVGGVFYKLETQMRRTSASACS